MDLANDADDDKPKKKKRIYTKMVDFTVGNPNESEKIAIEFTFFWMSLTHCSYLLIFIQSTPPLVDCLNFNNEHFDRYYYTAISMYI